MNSNFSTVSVKITVIPNDDSRNVSETKAAIRSSRVLIDDSLFYYILPGDSKKRLYVEVWGKDESNSTAELIGCLSFGMKHLMQKTLEKPVQGWFYLLSKCIGRRKHIRAPTVAVASGNKEPSVMQRPKRIIQRDVENKHLLDPVDRQMSRLKVELKRTDKSFGFTITGSCPVRVGKIQRNSLAAMSGLETGDHIVCINNQDVFRMGIINVAKLINSTEHVLALDICRLTNPPGHQQEFTKTAEYENFPLLSVENFHSLGKFNKFPSPNGLSRHRNKVSYDFAFSDHDRKPRAESTGETEHTSFGNKRDETIYQQANGAVSLPGHFKDDTLCHSGCSRHNEPLSNLLDSGVSSEAVSMRAELDNGFFESSNDSQRETGFTGGFFSIVSPIRDIVSRPNYDVFKQPRNKCGSYKDLFIPSSMGNESFLKTDHHRRIEAIISTMVPEDINDSQIRQLINCEEKFVNNILNGAQNFSRPLSHCVIISRQHHAVLFQNIEKLMVLSEFNLERLKEICFSTTMQRQNKFLRDTVVDLYTSKILVGAYGQYMLGLPSSLRLLQDITRSRSQQFTDFIQGADALIELTIEEFLRLPLTHLEELVVIFQSLYRNSSIEFDKDFKEIVHIISVLTELAHQRFDSLEIYDDAEHKMAATKGNIRESIAQPNAQL